MAEWISVKDRLPKRGEKVLAYMNFSQSPELGFDNEICDNTYKGKLVGTKGTKKDVWHGKVIMSRTGCRDLSRQRRSKYA